MTGFNTRTFQQIREEIQRRIRSTETAAGTYDLLTGINRSINESIHDIVSRFFFDWTVREFWLNTVPALSSTATQAVSIQAGSDHITGSGTVFTAGMSGAIIFVSGGKVPYEILTISPTQDTARLVVGFEGTTDQPAAPFQILRDSFVIDSRIRAIRGMVLESGTNRWPMKYVPSRHWDKVYPRAVSQSRPYYYTVVRYTADGVPRIRFWPIPDTRYVLRFPAYTWLPELVSNSDTVEMPGSAQRILEDMAYARVLNDYLHVDEPHARVSLARAEEGLTKLVAESYVNPDWDMARAEPPYFAAGMPIVVFPPEFGVPVDAIN